MDIFGSDGDSDSDIEVCNSEIENLSNLVFIQLLICRPFTKVARSGVSHHLYRNILLVGTDEAAVPLKKKLEKSQFKHVTILSSLSDGTSEFNQFDIVVNVDIQPGFYHSNLLASGGTYLSVCSAENSLSLFPVEIWNIKKAVRVAFSSVQNADKMELIVIQKWAFKINTIGAVYWTSDEHKRSTRKLGKTRKNSTLNANSISHDGSDITDGSNCSNPLDLERSNLDDVTINLSLAERRQGLLSNASHSKAVNALQTLGLCILPGLFKPATILEWGAAAVDDMSAAIEILKEKDIDILNPSEGQKKIENFHELSMREALRCDLRNGRNIKALAARSASANVFDSSYKKGQILLEEVSSPQQPDNNSCESEIEENIRHHPALLSILREVLNPAPADPRDQLGNWGLWNFEGSGPASGPPEFAVGQVGAVMSLPGCADQTIHADTCHLYVHTQLPAHYINLFLPAVAADSASAAIEVGQTAFVLGSHQLRISAHIMNEEGGQEELEKRLVRPHLHAGDCLLFDCRILHFGLANQYKASDSIPSTDGPVSQSQKDGWRPLLYVNYHHKFFHDPKNWNDKEKLFD
jgi:Phytanoyl-CoA dioxygenase (PhyH)